MTGRLLSPAERGQLDCAAEVMAVTDRIHHLPETFRRPNGQGIVSEWAWRMKGKKMVRNDPCYLVCIMRGDCYKKIIGRGKSMILYLKVSSWTWLCDTPLHVAGRK